MKRRPLQLAAAVFAILAAGPRAHAQISSPDIIVSKPPRPPAQRQPPNGDTDTGKLQWLWQYTRPAPNGNAAALRFDERFGTLLERTLKQPQSMWGKDIPISTIVPRFLSRYGNVTVDSERYLTVDGCVPSFCPAHGLLWIDMGSPHPLIVFVAVDWTTAGHATDEPNADFNLWLFPNKELSPDAIPAALATSLSHWDARLAAAHRLVPHIAHAILVQPSGQPTALDPAQIGMNTLPPQPDTLTPARPEPPLIMTLALHQLANAVTLPALLLAAMSLPAQKANPASGKLTEDATWAKAYATVCDGHSCRPDNTHHQGSDIKWDPHFLPLLRRALPQHQGWWVDGHIGTADVSTTAQIFIGVPHGVVLNNDRYVTATGCVPHACSVMGMLWLDTARPATVIFVGEQLVVGAAIPGNKEQSGYHLFLYTSQPMATYTDHRGVSLFPADFVANLDRWHKASISKDDDQHILLVTVVWPNGRSYDYLYDDFFHQLKWPPPTTSPAPTGAKP